MFVDSLDNFANMYENKLNSIFDHWAKLYYLGLNVQPKIQILNGLYSMIRS